jgi:hypothetical protein
MQKLFELRDFSAAVCFVIFIYKVTLLEEFGHFKVVCRIDVNLQLYYLTFPDVCIFSSIVIIPSLAAEHSPGLGSALTFIP